jgi:hypothetical protein
MLVLAWGAPQAFDLMNRGYISVFDALLPFLALLAAVYLFWLMRWWGLALAASAAIYVFMSPFGGVSTLAFLVAFYAPTAVAAVASHQRFKW